MTESEGWLSKEVLCQISFLLCLFLYSLPVLTRFLPLCLLKSLLFLKSLSWSVGPYVHHETRSFLSLSNRSAPIVSLIYSCSPCVYSTHSHSICPEIVSAPRMPSILCCIVQIFLYVSHAGDFPFTFVLIFTLVCFLLSQLFVIPCSQKKCFSIFRYFCAGTIKEPVYLLLGQIDPAWQNTAEESQFAVCDWVCIRQYQCENISHWYVKITSVEHGRRFQAEKFKWSHSKSVLKWLSWTIAEPKCYLVHGCSALALEDWFSTLIKDT